MTLADLSYAIAAMILMVFAATFLLGYLCGREDSPLHVDSRTIARAAARRPRWRPRTAADNPYLPLTGLRPEIARERLLDTGELNKILDGPPPGPPVDPRLQAALERDRQGAR